MNLDFWDKRMESYGHTSWSDFKVYIFEYYLKKRFLENFLQRRINSGCAMDFGGGIGDFANTLVPYFDNVYLVEPSLKALSVAKKRLLGNVTCVNSTEKIGAQRFSFCLAINVIQHLSNEEIRDLLEYLLRNLVSGGEVLVINSVTQGLNYDLDSYTILYNEGYLVNLFKEFDLDLISKESFWTPYKKGLNFWTVYEILIRTLAIMRLDKRSNVVFFARVLSKLENAISKSATNQQVFLFKRN